MKLENFLNTYTNVSTAMMTLHLAKGETVRVSPQLFAIIDEEGSLKHVIERDEDKAIFPWLELRDRFGTVIITDFSITDNQLIFWEKGAL